MVTMTKEEMQKYWDAMLIRSWRQFGTVGELRDMFLQTCGVSCVEAGILRITPPMHGMSSTRAFVASYLPKINDRLLSQDPAKDVLLLRKLQSSPYDTMKKAMPDAEREAMYRQRKEAKLRIGFETLKAGSRNRDTDWNVVK